MLGTMKNGKPVTPRKAVDHKGLKARRVASGVSGKALAQKLGLDDATFYGYESGRYRPTAEMAKAWAKAVRGLK